MGSEARSFIPESEQSPKGPKRPDLKLVVDNTDRLSPEDARLEALLDEVANENDGDEILSSLPDLDTMSGDGLATTEQATAFENQRQTEIAKDEEKRQAEIAKARELFKTMEARKAELQKREAIAKLEREEIAKARKIIAEQKSSEIAGMIDETLTQIEEGQRAEAFFEAEKEKAHNNFRVDMRGTAVNNERQTPDLQKLNIAREQKISTETALQNQTRIQDMERKLSTSFERARPFITPRERAELVPLQEKLKMAQDLNDAEIYQSVVAQIQVKLNRYQNENPVTGFAKPLQATEQKPNIILTNPKTKPSLISKIGKFFGFGK